MLVGVRARASLAAPEWQLQRLAFGQHLFGVLGAAGVRTYALPGATLLIDHPLASPSGIVALAGGSLLASGRTDALRLDPGATKAVRLPPLPMLPGTLLLPERRDSAFVWAAQTATQLLVRQRLELDPTRSFDRDITLEDAAKFMGHLSDYSIGSYGHAAHGRKGRGGRAKAPFVSTARPIKHSPKDTDTKELIP